MPVSMKKTKTIVYDFFYFDVKLSCGMCGIKRREIKGFGATFLKKCMGFYIFQMVVRIF